MNRLVWLFAFSGLAGLLYEVTWTRYLATFVGHTAFAQAIVLFVFLGGMAIGSILVADRAARISRPLAVYAWVEAGLGLSAILFQPLYAGVADLAYQHLFPSLGSGIPVLLTQWLLAALLVFPPSVLMGMTFPLMSAALLGRGFGGSTGSGSVIARLYAANSLGAALGVLLTGFVLVVYFGLHTTLLIGGALNGGVALVAWYLARHPQYLRAEHCPPLSDPAPALTPDSEGLYEEAALLRRLWPLLLGVSGGTAVASYLYEIAWIRMLALVLGSATHAFELMLSAFILGIAGGAFWVRRRADAGAAPGERLVRVQLVMGISAIATIALYTSLFEAMAWLMQLVPKTGAGYWLFTSARYGLALGLMLPTTVCAGMTLPLLSAVLLRQGAGARTVGAVYGINSVGAILGVALGALALMPRLGVRGLLLLGAGIDIALGLLLLWALPQWLRRAALPPNAMPGRSWATQGLALAAGLALIAGVLGPAFDPVLLASGVFRTGYLPTADDARAVSHVDGRTATVTVEQSPDGIVSISTNGKPDASVPAVVFGDPDPNPENRPGLSGDASTQALLPLVALAHHPGARQVALIGHGSGQTGHLLLASQAIRSLTTVEIEPEMVRASRLVGPVNWRVFRDPRSRFTIDDARAYFAATRSKFDLIVSEPSNPWVSGVSGLFTIEFYTRIRDALAPGGVFGQWLQLYESTDTMLLSVVAALDAVFADYRIYLVDTHDVLIVASMAPIRSPDWSVATSPSVKQDLRWFQPLDVEHLDAGLLLDRATVVPLLSANQDAPIRPNTDDRPLLDVEAERARFLGQPAGLPSLAEDPFDVPAALHGWVRPLGRRVEPTTGVPRSSALAVGARLRRGDLMWDTSLGLQLDYDEWAERLADFRAALRTGRPPEDWQEWSRDALELEDVLHAGSAGVADSSWFRPVARYADRAGAPPAIRALLRFRFAMARHDWPRVVAEIDRVMPLMTVSRPPMSPTTFRSAAVVALLKAGPLARAESLLGDARLGPPEPRDLPVFRLLAAHVADARRQMAPAP